jgi:hypothetical protein
MANRYGRVLWVAEGDDAAVKDSDGVVIDRAGVGVFYVSWAIAIPIVLYVRGVNVETSLELYYFFLATGFLVMYPTGWRTVVTLVGGAALAITVVVDLFVVDWQGFWRFCGVFVLVAALQCVGWIAVEFGPFQPLMERILRRRTVADAKGLHHLESELESRSSIFPRFLRNAPVALNSVMVAPAQWESAVTIMLSHVSCCIIDATTVVSHAGLQWEVEEASRIAVPTLFMVRRDTYAPTNLALSYLGDLPVPEGRIFQYEDLAIEEGALRTSLERLLFGSIYVPSKFQRWQDSLMRWLR